jgi:uncharacterized protein (DUF486 family)
MKKAIFTIVFLILSNTFMTFAWYGHLKFKSMKGWENLAFFEYCFQVPANRIGFEENGGPFSLLQLKVIQEVITLSVFVVFSMVFFKSQAFQLKHILGFGCLILAVFFFFKD